MSSLLQIYSVWRPTEVISKTKNCAVKSISKQKWGWPSCERIATNKQLHPSTYTAHESPESELGPKQPKPKCLWLAFSLTFSFFLKKKTKQTHSFLNPRTPTLSYTHRSRHRAGFVALNVIHCSGRGGQFDTAAAETCMGKIEMQHTHRHDRFTRGVLGRGLANCPRQYKKGVEFTLCLYVCAKNLKYSMTRKLL